MGREEGVSGVEITTPLTLSEEVTKRRKWNDETVRNSLRL